jgi:lipid II:glycine glycyltransferase (peptidoglycan interpeptide bridge formation enzyme)
VLKQIVENIGKFMPIHTNISEIDTKQWQQLVDNSLVASFFQTKECYGFYASLSFLEPFVFGISENDKLAGVICGYIIADGGKIKQFFSQRAIIPGGALLDENISDEALQALLNFTAKTLKNKAIYIEFRNYSDYSKYKTSFKESGFIYYPHLNFHISTFDLETSFSNMKASKRRCVRLSQKEGAEIIEIKESIDLKAYYELLSDLYKRKVKTPLYPYDFFEKLVQLPLGKIFAIRYNSQIIGGSACVCLDNKTIYQWFLCGLDGKYKNVYPSILANWATIEYAARNHFSRFDMMGAGKPDEDYGVRIFKAEFGGTLVEHGRFLCICNKTLYKMGQLYVEKIKK